MYYPCMFQIMSEETRKKSSIPGALYTEGRVILFRNPFVLNEGVRAPGRGGGGARALGRLAFCIEGELKEW